MATEASPPGAGAFTRALAVVLLSVTITLSVAGGSLLLAFGPNEAIFRPYSPEPDPRLGRRHVPAGKVALWYIRQEPLVDQIVWAFRHQGHCLREALGKWHEELRSALGRK